MADYTPTREREYELSENNRHMDIHSLSYNVLMLLRGPSGFGGGIDVGVRHHQPHSQQGTTYTEATAAIVFLTTTYSIRERPF